MSVILSLGLLLKFIIKWIVLFLVLFGILSAILYSITDPKKDSRWTIEHALLPEISFDGINDASRKIKENPTVSIINIRNFQWLSKDIKQYKQIKFQLKDIVGLKAVVSHFAPVNEIAHVFLIFVLNDGREFGISIEARREAGEQFSLSGGLFAKFELIYVLATPEDLLGIRKKNNESVHIYPIKASEKKTQELFLLMAAEVNALIEEPALYHLLFKNCTNQLVKNVSILTERKYPWYFQTLAPGKTGEMLYELGLIDLPETDFQVIQEKTRVQ